MEKIDEFKEKLKEDLGDWEEKIFGFTCDLSRTLDRRGS